MLRVETLAWIDPEGRSGLGRVGAGDDGDTLAGGGEEEVEGDQGSGRRQCGARSIQDEADGLDRGSGELFRKSSRPVRAESRARAVAAIALPEGVALSWASFWRTIKGS